MIHSLRKISGLFNRADIGDRQMDNIADIDMDSDLTAELTCADIVTVPLSPSLFDSVSDSCADDVLTLESGDVLPDISTLEEFMDLTEFFDFFQATDQLLPVAGDVGDATVCVQLPYHQTSLVPSLTTADTALPALHVTTTLVDIKTIDDADHTYHHASKRKCPRPDVPDPESIVAARHAQYLERRRKNNAASRRSRATRKRELMNMEEEVRCLEQKNAKLRQRVAEMEKMAEFMKSAVVDAIRQAQ